MKQASIEFRTKNIENSGTINSTLSDGLDDQVWHLVAYNISVDTFRFRDTPYPKWVI